jgi:hypothetical protein
VTLDPVVREYILARHLVDDQNPRVFDVGGARLNTTEFSAYVLKRYPELRLSLQTMITQISGVLISAGRRAKAASYSRQGETRGKIGLGQAIKHPSLYGRKL